LLAAAAAIRLWAFGLVLSGRIAHIQLSSLMSLTCISIFHIGATTAKESDETHNAIVRRSGYIIPPEREGERGAAGYSTTTRHHCDVQCTPTPPCTIVTFASRGIIMHNWHSWIRILRGGYRLTF